MGGKKKAAPHTTPARGGSVRRGEARDGGKPIKVRATALGYYADERKRVGDVFEISSSRYPDGKKKGELREFSDRWMEFVDARTPVRTTTSQQALNRETHRVAAEKAGRHVPDDGVGTPGQDVL